MGYGTLLSIGVAFWDSARYRLTTMSVAERVYASTACHWN